MYLLKKLGRLPRRRAWKPVRSRNIEMIPPDGDNEEF